MANYYRGAEIKFKLELEAEGFDMDRDDFKIDVVSGNTKVSGDKWNSQANDTTIPEEARQAVIIFRDPALSDSSDDSDSSGSIDEEEGWYAIVNTTTLDPTEEEWRRLRKGGAAPRYEQLRKELQYGTNPMCYAYNECDRRYPYRFEY